MVKKTSKEQFIALAKSTSQVRKHFFKDNFLAFWLFYYRKNFVHALADFHYDWIEVLVNTELHLLLEAFRWALKTEIIKAYIVWSICYKRYNFIVWQSFENKSSEESLRNIAKMLLNPILVSDFGNLFPLSSKKWELDKKSVLNFNTTNWIKVVSRSLWEKLRWASSYDFNTWSSRPDLLILDDIDVDDSVNNSDTIDKNIRKLKWETIWAMSKEKNRILFLWNTIKADWIVPRFVRDKKNSKFWKIFRQPLLEWNKIVWDFITEEKVEEFKEEWEISFNQNCLLIPYSEWDAIIRRHQIKYIDELPNFDYISIWVDPAISEKTKSDPFAIVVTWHIWDNNYVLEWVELKWKQKDPFKSTQIVKNLYIKRSANMVRVEAVAYQTVMAKLLRAEWVAAKEVNAHRDKVTRLVEKQHLFEQWKVFFYTQWTQTLVDQLLEFPNVAHDDLVDAMVYSFNKKKKKLILASL